MQRFYKILFKFLFNYVPILLVFIPLAVVLYVGHGNPSEEFLDTLNTICLYIIFTPIFSMLFLSLYMTLNGDFDDKKCKCCCKRCHC